MKYPFNPSSPRCLKLISSWSLKEVSTHTLTQTGQNCCFLALCFFSSHVISCPQMSVQKNMFSLLALSTNSLQLKCVYTATRPGKSYRFHRNFISLSSKQTYKHTHSERERERRPLQSPVHVSQIPCVLWHRLSNTEIECV